MAGKISLTVLEGVLRGQIFARDQYDTLLCGRQEDCQICLGTDEMVSRHHCLLEMNPPQVRLRDLGSRNGTFINGIRYGGRAEHEDAREGALRVHPSVDLHHNDLIRVGETLLRLEIRSQSIRQITLCQRCGRDVSTEIVSGREGDFLCTNCRQQIQTDPAVLLLAVAEQKPRRIMRGIRLADYWIKEKISDGGMGSVYLLAPRARTRGHELALKVMLPRTAVNEYARESFRREIESTRLLKHPHIVDFLGGGVEKSIFYCLLEYCSGGSIMSLMKRLGRHLTLVEASPLMLQSLKGLAYMHQRGYVHRDLKPQNILLSGTEGHWQAKIADLGLAKNFMEAGLSGMTMTDDGWIGSFDYMPREQAVEFRFVRPASDIWAIGASFYVMLTGKVPRPRKPGQEPVEAILNNQAIPLLERNPQLPPALAALIDRSLDLDPKARYQTADEMLQAMYKVLKH